MGFLFRKKQWVQAFAVTLENGRDIADREMSKLRYQRKMMDEPMFDVTVRVETSDMSSFEAKMKAGLSRTFLLLPGVRVQVKYDPHHPEKVFLDDEIQAILQRNPQLLRKAD